MGHAETWLTNDDSNKLWSLKKDQSDILFSDHVETKIEGRRCFVDSDLHSLAASDE